LKHFTDHLYDSVLVLFVVILIAILLAPSVLVVSYIPSVLYRLRTGKADITFQNVIHFSDIRVRSNAVVFDSVGFGIEKAPATGANLVTTITIWIPAVQSGTAIEFVGASLLQTHDIYFNLTGLQSLSYDIKVNGATQATLPGPTISFLWSNWNAQETIAFVVAVAAPPPGSGGGLPFQPIPKPFDWMPLGVGFAMTTVAVVVLALLVRYGFLRGRGVIRFQSRLSKPEMQRLREAARISSRMAKQTVVVLKQPIHTNWAWRPKRMRKRKYRTR